MSHKFPCATQRSLRYCGKWVMLCASFHRKKFVIFTSSDAAIKKFTAMKKLIFLIVALVVTTFCLNAQDAQAVVNNAIKSLGATDLKTLEYSGSGYVFSF